jgi:hypothetical protein
MDRRSVNYISCFLSYNFVCVMAVYIWSEMKLNSERMLNFDLLNIFNRLFTCMNLGSGGATIGLMAEVTGLAGFTGSRSGFQNHKAIARSEI